MEQAVCLSEEQFSERCDFDSSLFEIADFDINGDMLFLAELYWQFCKDANDEDISALKTFQGPDGPIEVSEAEARILGYLYAGWKIKVCYFKNVMTGFLIYQRIFENIVVIRCCYAEPFKGLKLAKRLVNSLQPKHLIFQTLKANKPERCLEITENYRKKIADDNHFETWIMDWRA